MTRHYCIWALILVSLISPAASVAADNDETASLPKVAQVSETTTGEVPPICKKINHLIAQSDAVDDVVIVANPE